MKRLLVGIIATLSIGACTIIPEPIQVAENITLVPYEQILNNPPDAASFGEKARWGGRIVGVHNKPEVSEIEVVFFPEASNGKPKTGEESKGRFKALVPGFVDPLVFEKDRLITIVGDVTASQSGIIGEQNYTYPTLNAAGYFMWKQTTDVEVQNIGYQPFMLHGFYHRGWSNWYSPWHTGFQRSRVRVVSNNGHTQGSRVERQLGSASSTRQSSSAVKTSPSQPSTQQH